MRGRSPNRGFTLIEVMVVITIIGILAALSVVAISKMANRAKQTSGLESITSLILEARDVALAKNANVVILVDPSSSSPFGGVHELLDPKSEATATLIAGSYTYKNTGSNVLTNNFTGTSVSERNEYLFSSANNSVRFATTSEVTTLKGGFTTSLYPWAFPSGASGCSFCGSSYGYIIFTPEGTVMLSDPSNSMVPQKPGTQGLIVAVANSMPPDRAMFIATPSGLTNLVLR